MQLPVLTRYGIAVAAAALAVLLRLALDPVWGFRVPLITFYPAMMVSAWLGGFGPGILTTLLCAAAAAYFWIPPVHAFAVGSLADILALLVFTGIGAVISGLNEAWRRTAAAVTVSEQRLRVTLTSIGDGVIATDQEGRVTLLNGVAEALTGWTAAEAAGRPLRDVFILLNEPSRGPAESPVEKVLREGVISGLANHTVLISKDGREITIDDSAAPIRAADGRLLGVVMVFRDVTDRRRGERERAALLQSERAARTEVERVAERLRHLQAVTDTALADLPFEDLVRALLARVRLTLGSDTATILLLQPNGRDLVQVASEGLREEVAQGVRIPMDRSVAGRIAASEHGLLIDDLAAGEVASPWLREKVRSLVGTPLRTDDRLIGVIHAGSVTPRRFTEADLDFLRLVAERVAVAVERARLNEAERTARADAEEAEQRLQLALAAGGMGTWEWTIATGKLRWSPSLEAIHGLAPGSFAGTFDAFRREIHPDDRDRVLGAVAEAVEKGREHRVEYRIVRADGALRWVEGRGQLFRDAEGRPDRLIGVCSDVTERKQAEDRFRLAVEAAPAAMIVVDHQGTIRLVNALGEQLFGYARHELVGRPVEDLVPLRLRERHPGYRTDFSAAPRRRPMGAGRDLHALRKDGIEIPVEIGLSPFTTADGSFVLAAISDITERKQLEEERARLLALEQAARREAEAANRGKDEFLAVLSHELRTPLTTILGWVQMLRTLRLDAPQRERALDTIERNTRAQTRMIDDLLDMSRIAAGKMALERRPVSVGLLIAETVESFQHEARVKGLVLETQLDPAAGTVSGDADRLRQVLVNLLGNAIKYTPSGRVDIALTTRDGVVRVVVGDTGMGIERELLPHVFERFRQADWKTAGTQRGLGLGLAIVREIVEMHGGAVEAQSDGPGRGSTFVVTLPLTHGTTGIGPASDA